MKSLRRLMPLFRFLFALLVFAIALTLLIRGASGPAIAHSPQSNIGQGEEKSLEIVRYPNEPLQLVDLKIHENSVKDKINSKFKDKKNEFGLDNVRFSEKPDWFKNIRVRLRNISDAPIIALSVSLLFNDQSLKLGFAAPLKQAQGRDLKQSPLRSGEELDLIVDDARLNQILAYMYQNGVDANQPGWRLSTDSVWFGEDFGWEKGSLLRRNSFDPKKWDKIDKPEPSPFPFEASRLFQPAGFKTLEEKSLRGGASQANLSVCVAAAI